MINLETRIKALEMQADATLNETDIITVIVSPDSIELTSDIFGKEVHERNGMTLQDIQDELSCRFDGGSTHFVYILNRDQESRQN